MGELKGTMFASKKIQFADFMKFLALYLSKDFSMSRVHAELNWSKNTIIRWCQLCGKACRAFSEKQPPIGGPGTIVEVDETFIYKRKYNRGRLITQYWMLGGRERGTDKKFLCNLEGKRRTAANMVLLTKQHVLPGGKLITDCHRSYSSLSNHGYEHETINHRVNYVRDGDVHTQTIERLWRDVKEHIKGRSRNADFLSLHICRYILISSFENGGERLHNFLMAVAALYPL